MKNSWNYAIVVGASSGIGEMIARQLAATGARVALLARSLDDLERIVSEINREAGEERAVAVVHDVLDTGSVDAVIAETTALLGGYDLLVFSSGIMPEVAPDEYDLAKDERVIRVNTIGAVAWIGQTARRFGERGSGTIVGISSIAGERGRRGNPAYGASKAAMSSYLESIRNRVAVRGVTVVTVKPGFIRTPMTSHIERLPLAVEADRAAGLILRAAQRGSTVAYIPARWRLIAAVLHIIPSFIFRRLNV